MSLKALLMRHKCDKQGRSPLMLAVMSLGQETGSVGEFQGVVRGSGLRLQIQGLLGFTV